MSDGYKIIEVTLVLEVESGANEVSITNQMIFYAEATAGVLAAWEKP